MKLLRNFAAVIVALASLTSYAEMTTYSLDSYDMDAACKATAEVESTTEHYVLTFSHNDVEWTIEGLPFTSLDKPIKHFLPPEAFGPPLYYLIDIDFCNDAFESFELRTKAFAGRKVSRVELYGAIYTVDMSSDGIASYCLTIGDYTETVDGPYSSGNNKHPLTPVVFEPNAAIGDEFSLKITSPKKAQGLELHYLKIEFDAPERISVVRVERIFTGHRICLESENPDATIYYTLNGEDWHTYSNDEGIIFDTPGTFDLTFFAATGEIDDPQIFTEKIEVESSAGIRSAIAANRHIAVAGIVEAQFQGYTLISSESNSETKLAVDNSRHPDLAEAKEGSKVTLEGRPTDRFGADVDAVGSLRNVTVNGEEAAPTSLTSLKAASVTKPSCFYELNGRKASPHNTARRIVITPEGPKFL